MYGSTSARALDSSRGSGLAERKEQVQKEILAQKELIEKLEGRVASLSGRGGHRAAPRGSSAPPQEESERGTTGRHDIEDRPATTTDAKQPHGEEGDHDLDGSARAKANSQSRGKGKSCCQEVADHGPNARRDSLRRSSQGESQAGYRGQQRTEQCAVEIQRNVRGASRRKRFLTLQAAREELEHHLQALVSAAATALAHRQHQQDQQPNDGRGAEVDSEGKAKNVSIAAERLLETSREDGLAKPPFEILRAMYCGLSEVTLAVECLSAAEEEEAGGVSGRGRNARISGLPCAATTAESCDAAKEALDAIREAVGADTTVIGETAHSTVQATASSPNAPRDHQYSPAGSGRAAAIAMTSARGGLLVSVDEPPTTDGESLAGKEHREVNDARNRGGSVDPGDTRPAQSVPLRSLDVERVAQLLRLHGFEEHVPGFVAQAVDGVMLSDPNLCEADLAELGLGGRAAEGAQDSRARMVSFFRKCQRNGVVFPVAGGSSPSFGGKVEPRTDSVHNGDSTPDDRRRNDSATLRKKEMGGLEGSVPGESKTDRTESTQDSPWRRGSVLVDRENQRVIAQISLDSSDTGRGDATAFTGTEGGRRMSVKLNQGVVITAGGREAGSVENMYELPAINAGEGELAASLEAAAAAAATAAVGKGQEGGDGAAAAVRGSENSPAGNRGRRTSLGLPTVTLYKESNGGLDSEEAGGMPIPPGVPVTTANSTVNVFR
ncbi:hypothetical protein Esi_0008_0109 [Ectocarpus siliculosus]|uniref:SAM domain-containing protein n=1 Tax=Ectocarpus siliculosus TaxID=2880 RepID=D7G6Z4_ECTSI|nr:hypothetical protein Esi_0008_0109 [Ectocarpus siliculosus]|eukprot:CBJ25687.1 hypothetical protein Esi_0008_0109 [Ectocarpus siliculosus]